MRKALVILVAGGALLASCGIGGDPARRDPADVCREFMIAIWSGDTDRVEQLSCRATEWNFDGDPSVTIDADHLTFEVIMATDVQAEVVMSGVVTFKAPDGQAEVRSFDDSGPVHFFLQDQGGWKVCDLR